MNVLFVPRPDWKSAFGGDAVQMNETAAQLRLLGVEVTITRPEEADLKRYDVVHLWTSLQMPVDLAQDVQKLQAARPRAKLVNSPVWAPQHLMRWMTLARAWLFGRHADLPAMSLASAQADLRQIADRALIFTVPGEHVDPFGPRPGSRELRAVLSGVDMILPNSWTELRAIHEFTGIVTDSHVVPNAVDPQVFLAEPSFALPPELQDVPFALMSARFDSRKQQDFALLALKDLDVPLVFIGEVAEQPVFERFKNLGARRAAPVYYFGRMKQAALAAFYRAARVHFLPSMFESPGLSSIEAALLDCTLVTGGLAFESEYFQESAYYCDPCDAWSIARAVETAFGRYDADQGRRDALRERIAACYTWEQAAQATLAAYNRVLQA